MPRTTPLRKVLSKHHVPIWPTPLELQLDLTVDSYLLPLMLLCSLPGLSSLMSPHHCGSTVAKLYPPLTVTPEWYSESILQLLETLLKLSSLWPRVPPLLPLKLGLKLQPSNGVEQALLLNTALECLLLKLRQQQRPVLPLRPQPLEVPRRGT